ncbi:MAG: hypothetical protein LAT62_03280 [Natronospirillum sp.]|uniref:hypothetical protein n=1 Tax=Natronospirillum sp. TaxID=2812955 RepID=UPI0025FD376C|nr:hypothetical protein [Natronospirillum sp.]MCH8550932.1 hypothetical protein [Natronospirillum sp.]
MGALLFFTLLVMIRWGLPDKPASVRRLAVLAVLTLLAALATLQLSAGWVLLTLCILALHALPERLLAARHLNLSRLLALLMSALLLILFYYIPGTAIGIASTEPLAALPDLATKYLAMVLGGLLLANEANYLIRVVFQRFHLEPMQASSDQNEPATIDQQEYNAGRIIGILERWIIYLVVVTAQYYTIIALIIAAKGFARFRQMDERPFAEYVLIGTLLSTLLTIVIAEVVLRLH